MKYWTISIVLVLAVLFNLSAVQAPLAAEITTVSGTIQSISERPNMVVVDGTEVYGISFNKIEAYNIFLEEGDMVSIDAYEFACSSGAVVLKAASITIDDITIALRPLPKHKSTAYV